MESSKEPTHTWVGATNTELTDRQARLALLRGVVRLPQRHRLPVVEVYCGSCMRPYESVAGKPCEAKINNEHLRGGPIGERKKRTGSSTITSEHRRAG